MKEDPATEAESRVSRTKVGIATAPVSDYERAMRDLAAIWLYVADSSCRGYSPLYDRICRTVAESDEVLDLVSEAPPRGHNPVLLLAAVHYLLLGGARSRAGGGLRRGVRR